MGDITLKDKGIVVATHSFSTGPPQELKRYLIGRAKRLLYISHPFSYCKEVSSWMELYEEGRLARASRAYPVKGPELFFYAKDVFLTLYYTLKTGVKYDIFIGADNLNALSGLLLRAMGRVGKVVFYTIDYIPVRFENRFVNRIYHLIDKLCCYHADCVWNISPKVSEGRFSNGVKKERCAPHPVVPNGSNFKEIKRLPVEEIERHSIAFMGHLRKNQGIELAISALPKIREKIPDAALTIIGTGPLEGELKALAARLGVEGSVHFTGFLKDHAELESRLARCAVSVAPYAPSSDSFTYYADPGKPKTYLAAGLPVVITGVPAVAAEIEARRAGILIRYDEDELADAVVRLLSDDALYREYRENAIALGAMFEWSRIFADAFKTTFNEAFA